MFAPVHNAASSWAEHDVQITIGGLEHGLTPLAEACPAVHVIERPTEFLGALWLPYRRQRAELEQALRAAGPAKAVFAHADVVRAPARSSSARRLCMSPSVDPCAVVQRLCMLIQRLTRAVALHKGGTCANTSARACQQAGVGPNGCVAPAAGSVRE